jgi:hypothetical protein
MLERPELLEKLIDLDNRAKRRDRNRRRGGARDGESFGLPAARVRDLVSLFAARYGDQFPDDDAGREDFEILAVHVLGLKGDRSRNLKKYAARWCPWMTETELEAVKLRMVAEGPLSAVELGKLVRLTRAELLELHITTMRPFDRSAKQLERERRDRQNAKKRAERKRSRADVKAEAAAKRAAIEAEGISKSQWYRRREKMAEKHT